MFRYYLLGATLRRRAGCTLGFATHFYVFNADMPTVNSRPMLQLVRPKRSVAEPGAGTMLSHNPR